MTPTEFKDYAVAFSMLMLRLTIGIAMAVAIYFAFTFLSFSADNLPRCMSYQEARDKWPRTHLWWTYDDGDKCWSNVRGRRRFVRNEVAQGYTPDLKSVKWYPRSFDGPFDPLMPPLNIAVPDNDDCCWPTLNEFDKRWAGVPTK